ncbi:DUF3732 domain-containing protein [Lacrimispora sp.]|uniref:DUF3732 domain-containing protein n=1 Tax=Lacrimispora sp. TaxID=2719234 RepID=UPI002896DB54|nr:DUF3732 domain-containing protein [Lacrimispora sp.]
MQFSIDSIILWPRRKEFQYKKIPFMLNKVNIITGASRTGKSAIIPIIDYCLASDKCAIPVDIIRNACEWFGVVFNLQNEQILLCRREPGTKNTTTEMFIMRGKSLQIPDYISANTTVDAVKNTLNELFAMSFLDIDPSSNNFYGRPSYRDFMAFLFQPQNIVANADVLFYKADTMDHRQKLINIFPYVLGALTPQTLAARQEIERLKRERERLHRDLNTIKQVSENWRHEIASWLNRAHELGLTEYAYNEDDSFDNQLKVLRTISDESQSDSSILAKNVEKASEELLMLRKEEQTISSKLFAAQQRYTEMKQLSESMNQYEHSLHIQLKRLDISNWLRSLYTDNSVCPLCGGKHDDAKDDIDVLCQAIAELEKECGDMHSVPAAFERELQTVKKEIGELSEKLYAIRNRIDLETNKSDVLANHKYTFYSIAKFLGQLENSLQTYDKIGQDGEFEERLLFIDGRLQELFKIVDEHKIEEKINAALQFIQLEANKIVSDLDVERPKDPIEIVIKDLTIRVKNLSGRSDYLWEIGSASNWLAYHIAVILAFQKFFLEKGTAVVPSFVVFDQPSQVYFPQKLAGYADQTDQQTLADEDKAAVKKIFTSFAKFVNNTENKIQIIVMEHADEDIWGDIDDIHLVKRWRGNDEKLVPNEWIEK